MKYGILAVWALSSTLAVASHLHDLVRSNDVDGVRLYLSVTPHAVICELHALNEYGLTPLELAKDLKNEGMVELLIAFGADIFDPQSSSINWLRLLKTEPLSKLLGEADFS